MQSTGIARIFAATQNSAIAFAGVDFGTIIMICIACVLLYLAIVKGFEPLLLMPIAFGMLLANMPGANIMHNEMFVGTGNEEHFVMNFSDILHNGGLFDCFISALNLEFIRR